jgi:hypothetical protein
MKKLLLIGLILAICILAFPQGVMAAQTAPVTVNAQFSDFLCLTASNPVNTWTLDFSQLNYVNTLSAANGITLNPDASRTWKITVYNATDRKFFSPTATPHLLTNVLKIATTDANDAFTDIGTSVTPLMVASGNQGTFAIKRGLQQSLNIVNDKAASDYRIVLTFDISNGV